MRAAERSRRWRALPLWGCLLATPPVAHAAIPQTVTYQGRLSQSTGVPVNGTVTMAFSLYTVAQETEPPTPPLWTETHSVVVVQGLFTAILGASTLNPQPLTLPFDRPYYLGIRVGTDPEMTPRQPFTSAPYALRANQADSVPSGSVTTETLADGAVSPDKLAEVCQEGDFLVRTIAGWDCRSTACLTPGTEVCDNLDNDCDGVVDEGYRNVTTGQYDQATACGNCSTDCTVVFARPHAQGQCDATGSPRCVMTCDADYLDRNGVPDDGCELRLDGQAIYVSGGDAAADDLAGCGNGPAGTGGGNRPCRTITRGIAEAVSTGRSKVLVADALYEEVVTLANGVSLLGGHRPDTWERHAASTLTILRAAAQAANAKTLVAQLITSATLVEGFVIEGPRNAQRAGNSYAVWIRDSGASLGIRDNVIRGGTGGPGLDGAAGGDGAEGVGGNAGQDAIETSVSTLAACQGAVPGGGGNQGAFGDGGLLLCGASSVAGGFGAGAVCPVSNNQQATGANGQSAPAGAAAGAGGAGGNDRYSTNCSTFITGGTSAQGLPGAPGSAGAWGTAGAGCTVGSGVVSGSEWIGSSGGNGLVGASGGGGGGGGAGGGADVQIDCSGTPDDVLGGSGGGGGSGACGGAGGGGGASGGGAFAVFVSFSAASSNLPVLTGNTVARGWGGAGGRGGNGGSGGRGGPGAAGGNVTGRWAFAMGAGGHGGDGGHGGHGSGGGGGCGGASYGILVHNASGTPPYRTGNVFLGGGGGGTGGAGGGSVGNSGTAGADGSSGDTNF